ncbi:unnamed protein product [Periconia digitata]|uniref:Uncharacterized protein n=1 Tax=Periconia digitata TaxID=1303443 RepID=A0A9W4XEE2_9PLEO|nr:unnamed protein product [Periconia digitata]
MANDTIKEILKIRDATYLKIYEEMEAALAAAGVLGRPIRSNSDKGKAARIAQSVAKANPDVFNSDKTSSCLMEIARRCNRNFTRAMKRKQRYYATANTRKGTSCPGHLPGEDVLDVRCLSTCGDKKDFEPWVTQKAAMPALCPAPTHSRLRAGPEKEIADAQQQQKAKGSEKDGDR